MEALIDSAVAAAMSAVVYEVSFMVFRLVVLVLMPLSCFLSATCSILHSGCHVAKNDALQNRHNRFSMWPFRHT